MSHDPPRLATVLLRVFVSRDLLDVIRGDLDEKFHRIARTDPGIARRWYWGQVLRSVTVPFARARDARATANRYTRGEFMQRLIRDVRIGMRSAIRSPGFTAVVILTVGLGIGANTAIFSVVDGVLLRPLQHPEPKQLISVWADYTRRQGPPREWLSYPDFHDLRQERDVFHELGIYFDWLPTLSGLGEAEQLFAAGVSEGMFSRVLRVTPILGRGFLPEDDMPEAENVVLLSHGFWTRAFGADPSVVGSSINLGGVSYEIVGVMPARFQPPFLPTADLWRPTQLDLATTVNSRGNAYLRAIGRLQSGISLAAARARAVAVGERLERAYAESNAGIGFSLYALQSDITRTARPALWVLLGAISFVLLIACANVANLLLARMTARRSELAVRAALGAGAGRIAQQILAESLVLAGLGGVIGIVLAYFGTGLLVSLAPAGIPRIDEVGVDARILGFTALLTVAVGFLFGIVPALRAPAGDLHEALKEGGRGGDHGRRGGRLRSALISGQVALALILLVGAGLFIKSLQRLNSVDAGFDPEGKLTMQLSLPGGRYPDRQATTQFYLDLEDRLRALPGIERVASINSLPLSGQNGDTDFNIEGRPLPPPGRETVAWIRRVTPGYFETMGISILDGRGFTQSDDREASRVVIINETLAEQHFPRESAVGKRINVNAREQMVFREIVGVAENVKNFGIRRESPNAMYFPYKQLSSSFMFVVMQSSGDAEMLIPAVRRTVSEMDPQLALASVATLESLVHGSLGADRFNAMLLSLFAVVAFILAAVGLYGVVSYNVNQRMAEMGVRIALGAGSHDIRRMVVGRSLGLVGIGIGAGIAGAVALSRVARGLLYETSATDPMAFGAAAVGLTLIAMAAAAIPAQRATRIDPIAVLKSE